MPLQATSGAASYDAFGGGVPVVNTFVEDVFSCFLYTGNGTSKTITNGIDLSTKGGLVWVKRRAFSSAHGLIDTARGRSSVVYSNETSAESISSAGTDLTSFNTNGFSIGTNNNVDINISDNTFASWTFRKQPKFFDIQTWTGTGSNRTISHSLGSVPASIWVKRTDLSGAWQVYHRSLANTEYLVLNSTAAKATGATRWNSTTPTSTVFSIGTDATVNDSGATYVAYLFAHDAGGFGLTGTDNVISCGSYTGNAGTQSITLGYEPQWIMVKKSSGVGNWHMFDIMRGMPVAAGNNQDLSPNLPDAEISGFRFFPTSTGFRLLTETDGEVNASGSTYIYIAIRRGPMKVPTSGTSVFAPVAYTGTNVGNRNLTGFGFPLDLSFIVDRDKGGFNYGSLVYDRLRGLPYLITSATDAEGTTNPSSSYGVSSLAAMDGVIFGEDSGAGGLNDSADFGGIVWGFRRAPSVMDVVCYTDDGTGSLVVNHNLQAVPELAILKKRNGTGSWDVAVTNTLQFNLETDAAAGVGATFPALTSTTFTAPGYAASSQMVVYLFATCAGVSKVFSYTGNGSSQTINCGFTGGARFILIKRRNAVGDWYVWDTARGIVAGSDPHLSLNSTAAEVTTDDSIDTDSTGFIVNQLSATNINVSSSTYIGLAIA
jgi:hypothetical protein